MITVEKTSTALRLPHVLSARWLADGLALLGGLLYGWQSFGYAHTQASLLDEGAYLLKGYLFATGVYSPYEAYGPWTNHMPLAFLIPGYIQSLFGPGLRTGRFFAVALGLLFAFGLWVVVRRVGGRWLAALAVWAVAVNPAVVKLYSLANSQALLAGLLVWVLALTLGEKRRIWQIYLGAALAGIMLITRVNLTPVLFLLLAYLTWEYGWKIGLGAAASGLLPVIIAHALYWPEILRIWAHWIPADLAPFLQPYGHPIGSDPSWNPTADLWTRVISFFHGVRFHFIALMGALGTWLCWPHRKQWRSSAQFRIAVFLSVLLMVLVGSHIWAALGNNYCVFCYPVYLAFFSFLGLILTAVSLRAWQWALPPWRQALNALVVICLTTGLGYGAAQELGPGMLGILKADIPRVRDLRILPGTLELGLMLQDRLGLRPTELEQLMRQVLPALAGFISACAGLLVTGLLVMLLRRRQESVQISFGGLALGIFLAVGAILSPSQILGGGYRTYDCGGDVLRSYETAGAHLAGLIPPGAQVYWRGGDSAVPLLYLSGVRFFPAQINGDYSYRLGGDPDELARYGFWSEELARLWAEQADFILIEERLYQGWLRDRVEASDFNELAPTGPLTACDDHSAIHIYQRQR